MLHLIKIIPLMLVAWSLAVVPAFSQTAPDPQRRANILKLMHATGTDSIGAKVLDQIIGSLKTSLPHVPEKFWQDIRAGIKQDSLIDRLVPIFDRALTDAELREMIKFFESSVGRKFIDILPDVTAQSMLRGQEWGQEMSLRITRALEAQGYLKDGQAASPNPQPPAGSVKKK